MSGTSIRGSYSTTQFVLRLRDDVKLALAKDDESYEQVQAFSTYLHETIHWWQNIGSNYGFLFSLNFPTTALLAWGEIENLKNLNILSKPLTKFDEQYFNQKGQSDLRPVNLILNNYYDLHYAKLFGFDNNLIFKIIEDRRFFISVGHSYSMMWGNNISTLSIFDAEFQFLPNIKEWEQHFAKLQKNKAEGFGIDCPVKSAKLGIQAIFEGQAIFNQLQYLSSYLNYSLTFQECKNSGMLHGVYLKAVERFLTITGFDEPISLIDSNIGLFLLICDIAINPTNGFPLQIRDYKNFIYKNDPGARFEIMCMKIAENKPLFKNCIINYTYDEYQKTAAQICKLCDLTPPHEGCEKVSSWFNQESIKKLMIEESKSKYSLENLPIQVLFSKYLRFQEDKLKMPEFFCWIGFHFSNVKSKEDSITFNSLFEKHKALFMEGDDGEIKPAIFDHLDMKEAQKTFNSFYQTAIQYDVILQWIREDGEFDLSYNWLTNKTQKEINPNIKRDFHNTFGINLEQIEVM